MKIYLYNLWIFHSRVYTVPHCPSIYVYIIVTLRESIESLERECGLCVLLCGRETSLGFCSVRSSVPLIPCVSFNPACRHFQGLIMLRGYFFFLFSNENTACRNCKKTFALAQIYIVAMSIPWSPWPRPLLQTQADHYGIPWLSTLSRIGLCVCVLPCQSRLSPGVMSMHSSV